MKRNPFFLGLLMPIIAMVHLVELGLYAQSTFELKQPAINNGPETKNQPLFELLDSGLPNMKTKTDNKWGNNPFFKTSQPTVVPKKAITTDQTQPVNLFEYKCTAIWAINNEFKALVSGHIVKAGDTINNITVSKITKKDITVKRNNKTRTFRLGSVFYDFQI